jgi:hypothetical protein
MMFTRRRSECGAAALVACVLGTVPIHGQATHEQKPQMAEDVFKFNHANYGSYTTIESNALYGQPSFNSNIAYWPRVAQLGVRLSY